MPKYVDMIYVYGFCDGSARSVQKKVDTRDELLVNMLDVIACIKERQDALRRTTHEQHAKCTDVDGGIFENLLYPCANSVT